MFRVYYDEDQYRDYPTERSARDFMAEVAAVRAEAGGKEEFLEELDNLYLEEVTEESHFMITKVTDKEKPVLDFPDHKSQNLSDWQKSVEKVLKRLTADR